MSSEVKPNEVHLWQFETERFDEKADSSVLSEAEKERAKKISSVKRRVEYLASRAMVRKVLGGYLGLNPLDLRFEQNHFGKPSLSPELNSGHLHFNLSHSAGIAFLAVAKTLVGVDVESISRKVDYENLAKEKFAPAEQKALLNLSRPQLAEKFFEFWTLKEAYVKAEGRGLSIGLSNFWFEMATPDGELTRAQINFKNNVGDASLWQFAVSNLNDYRVAVALKAEDLKIKWKMQVS